MIIPEEIKKKIENAGKTGILICNSTATLYLKISYILEDSGKGFSVTKVRAILNSIYGIPERDILEAENYLKETGYILSKKEDIHLFYLSPLSNNFCKRVLNDETKKDIKTLIKDFVKEIKYSRRKGRVNRNELIKIGSDTIIYVDHGEADRIMGCIKNYKTAINLEGYNKRRYAYIIHEPTTNKEFLKRVYNEIQSISTFEPQFIEVESWDVKKFNKSLTPMINTIRRHSDILFSAMPRIAVISLFLQINLNELKFKQNWIYNEAHSYNYGNGKVIGSTFETKGSSNNNNSLVTFSENYSVRFEEMMPFGFYDFEINHIGFGNSNNTDEEYAIDKKSYKIMKELNIPNSKPFTVDYTSAIDVFNKLYYYRPGAIYVAGNRVVALGIAQYYLYCLKNPETMQIPKLISDHVEADNYSEGFRGPNMSVLKL